jgi:hypothetical protein
MDDSLIAWVPLIILVLVVWVLFTVRADKPPR